MARFHEKEACAGCRRQCSLLHGKKSSSLHDASFFKIMIGDGWKDSMPLPPMFARTVPGLVNKKTQLIDSDSQRWEVTIRKVNGYISFQRGWNDFVLAHGLRVGYFLCFDYTEPHFVVQIFNENALAVAGFSGNCRKSKRPRTNSSESDSEDSSCFVIDEGIVEKQCSGSRPVAEKCQPREKASDKRKSSRIGENLFDYESRRRRDSSLYKFDKGSTRKQCSGSGSDVCNTQIPGKVNNKGKSPMLAEKTFTSKTDYEKDRSCYTVKASTSVRCPGKANGTGKSPMVAENSFNMKSSYGKNDRHYTIDDGYQKRQCSGSRFDVDKSQSPGKTNYMEKSRAEKTFNSENAYERSLPLCKASYFEEPFYMIGQGDKEGEYVKPILDLSNFETSLNCSGVAEKNKAAIKHLRSPPVEVVVRNEENTLDIVLPTSAPDTEMIQKIAVLPSKASDILTNCKDDSSKNMRKLSSVSDNKNSEPFVSPSTARLEKRERICVRPGRNVEKCQVSLGSDNTHSKSLARNDQVTRFQKEGVPFTDNGKSLQQTVTGGHKLPSFPVTPCVRNLQTGETMLKAKRELTEITKTEPKAIVKSEPMRITEPKVIVKGEPMEIRPELGNYAETGIVKTEPPDFSYDASSPSTPTVFTVAVTRNLCSLELPTELPSADKERLRVKRRVVYARDPFTRLWPVLYHDRPEFKLLTAGWEAFCKANDIRLGDECTFEVENGAKDVYKVSILRK